MSRIFVLVAFFVVPTEIGADEKPPEIDVLMKQMTDAMREVDTILKTVQTRDDAEKSRRK